jgi:hypothetical protein
LRDIEVLGELDLSEARGFAKSEQASAL